MITNNRRWTIVILGIALGAMILLSASLSDVELSFGSIFSIKNQPLTKEGGIGQSLNIHALRDILLALLTIAKYLLPLAIIYFVISREARKNVLMALASLLWILAYYVLLSSPKTPLAQSETNLSEFLPPGQSLGTDIEMAYSPPQWLITLMTIGLSLLIAAMLVGVLTFIWRRIHRTASPFELLSLKAQDALEALHAGKDLKDTVMRCYYEMSRILSKQGITRDKAKTPREFERDLVNAGLPDEHVRQLTRLFEAVRYGAKIPGEKEERQAIACLSEIVEFSRSAI